MVIEAKSAEGGDALQRWYMEMYRPDPEEQKAIIAAQIASGAAEADFDAFSRAAAQVQ